MKLRSILIVLVTLSSCASAPLAPLVVTARTTGITGPHAPVVQEQGVLFSLYAPEATVVNIAGQFNGWSPEATALIKGPEGVWSVVLPLKKGTKHRYKYLIDEFWIPDPENPKAEPDGFGGYNSLLDLK